MGLDSPGRGLCLICLTPVPEALTCFGEYLGCLSGKTLIEKGLKTVNKKVGLRETRQRRIEGT